MTLRLALLTILTAAGVFAATVPPALVSSKKKATSGSSEPSCEGSQDFEGTGAPSGWAANNFGSDSTWDFSSSPIGGSQSLRLTNNAAEPSAYALNLWSGRDGVTNRFRVRRVVSLNDELHFFNLWDNGASPVVTLQTQASGVVKLSCGTATANTTATLSNGDERYIWVEYVKGSGANAYAAVYISATSTKPGSPDASVTTGSSTAQSTGLILRGAFSASDWVFDDFCYY